MAETAGSLTSIARYPIKSFQGESIHSTTLHEQGIFADRPFALRDKASGKVLSGKHARLGERILSFSARYAVDPIPGEALPEILVTIDSQEYSSSDYEGLSRGCSEALGADVEIIRAGGYTADIESYWPEVENLALSGATLDFPLPLAEAGSFADLEPLHVLTTASMAHLETLAPDSEIGAARFRPSLLIEYEAAGFVENNWVGRTASLGESKLKFGALAPRCIMTTRVQQGLPKDPSILKTLVQNNLQDFMGLQMPCLGIYASVVRPGLVTVGDPLLLD